MRFLVAEIVALRAANEQLGERGNKLEDEPRGSLRREADGIGL